MSELSPDVPGIVANKLFETCRDISSEEVDDCPERSHFEIGSVSLLLTVVVSTSSN